MLEEDPELLEYITQVSSLGLIDSEIAPIKASSANIVSYHKGPTE